MQPIIQSIGRQYDFNLLYANALVDDLSEAQMTFVPAHGLVNHPAFTLGHLVTGSAMMAEDLGGESVLPDGWASLFQRKGPNDQTRPDNDIAKYPSKEMLISELGKQHDQVKQHLSVISEAQLQAPVKWRFGNHMPSMLDLIMFMCISHESMHLGQLAAWRRAMDLPPALKML